MALTRQPGTASSTSGAKEAAGLPEDHGHGFAHLLEAFEGNWLTSKAYVQGKICLRFDFWIRAGDDDGCLKHHAAVFQRAPGVDCHPLGWGPDISKLNEIDRDKIGIAVNRGERRDERPVLVFVGEQPEGGQGMSSWAVESLVWLAELDEPESLSADPPDVPLPPFALPVARVLRRFLVEQREGIARRGFLAVGDDQLPDEVLKDSAEILDVIPDDNAPVKWRLARDADTTEAAGGLHIYLGDDPIGIGFCLEEGAYEGLERIKMEICAL